MSVGVAAEVGSKQLGMVLVPHTPPVSPQTQAVERQRLLVVPVQAAFVPHRQVPAEHVSDVPLHVKLEHGSGKKLCEIGNCCLLFIRDIFTCCLNPITP